MSSTTTHPVISVTEAARTAVLDMRSAETDAESLALRVEVSGHSEDGREFAYELMFEPVAEAREGDELHTSGDLPVLGMPGQLVGRAGSAGREVLLEGFPDRGYGADGRLLPRGEPGALLEDVAEIVDQALGLAPAVHSLCVHGDSPGAVGHARAIRVALEAAGWTLEGL